MCERQADHGNMGMEISEMGRQGQKIKRGGKRDEQRSVGGGTGTEWG